MRVMDSSKTLGFASIVESTEMGYEYDMTSVSNCYKNGLGLEKERYDRCKGIV